MSPLIWNRRAARGARPGRRAERPPEGRSAPAIGGYVTDGAALFRVERPFAGNGEPFVELEDYLTLELTLCSLDTLETMGLRAVTPAIGK